jgi:hypothetical protein
MIIVVNSIFSRLLIYGDNTGRSWTDPITKITNLVPGNDYFIKQNRDPYQDLVYLGKDLGLAGIDIGKFL